MAAYAADKPGVEVRELAGTRGLQNHPIMGIDLTPRPVPVRSDLAAFLDVEQEHVILFYEATPNELTACLPRNRSKGTKQPTALYFLKANASKITSSADVSTLGFGKLQLNSVEMFHSVLEEIYRPVIFENDKLANLPNNVALDLQRSLQTAVLTSQSLAQNQSVCFIV